MRRLLALVPSIAVVSAIVLGGSAADAIPHRSTHVMVPCPLRTSGPIPTCCGPPIESPDAATIPCCPLNPATDSVPPPCCGTVAPCSVSISASPNPANGKQQVTVSGAVLGGTPAGSTVELWQKAAGDRAFSDVGSATVGTDGTYSITAPATVDTNRQWYVVNGTLQSVTISEQVSAAVTLFVARTRHSASVRGAVSPSHAGETVLVQRKLRAKWRTIARPTLSHHSKFSVHYVGTPHIKATLRAVLPGDETNIRSQSPIVTAAVPPGI